MLTAEDIRYISKVMETSLVNEESVKFQINNKIKTIDLDSYSKGQECKDYNISYIDSSYTYNIVGPIAYIYARVVKVSKDKIETDKLFLILNDSFFGYTDNNGYEDKMSLQDLAELASKYLEYKIASLNKDGVVMIDGSIIADHILSVRYKEIFNKNIDKIYNEYKKYFERVINNNLISIAKRIVQAHLINKESSVNDVILLQKYYKNDEFFSGPYYIELNNPKKNTSIRIGSIYFRARKGDHIYRLEFVDNIDIDHLICIINKEINKNKRYPFGLKLAHYKSKITNKEKMLIEDLIRRYIGIDKAFGWETK